MNINIPEKYRDGLMIYEKLDAAYKKEGKEIPFKVPYLIPAPNSHFGNVQFTHMYGYDPLSEKEKTEATIEGRRQMLEAFELLKKHDEDFASLELIASAPVLGVRESRRIKGKYTLKYSDVIERRRFEDSITIARYLIDPWEPEGNPLHSKKTAESCRVPYYEIPYRCLISDECENLLFCGRCISTTHVVNASVRVMPICYMTGQAAGTAAALTYESGNCHKVDIKALQSDLRNQGMFVTLDDEPQSDN